MLIVNLYGPTETTLAKCYYATRYPLVCVVQYLGKPIGGVSIYILDEYLNSVPIGAMGEIDQDGDTSRCMA